MRALAFVLGLLAFCPVRADITATGTIVDDDASSSGVTLCQDFGTKFYVRDGGTGDGSNWTNAADQAATNPVRGTAYYFGPGSYSMPTLDTVTSGTTQIAFCKATVADHGTDTGWSDSYGIGTATFGGFSMSPTTDYWTFDGAYRDETCASTDDCGWNDASGHGFRVVGAIESIADIGGACTDNVRIRYVNVGGPESATADEAYEIAVKANCYTTALANNWIIERSYLHNIAHFALAHMNGVGGCEFTENYFGPAWGKEAIRGGIKFKNCKITRNIFVNSCGTISPDACTAEIAAWENDSASGDFDGNEISGNIIYCDGCDGGTSSVAILVGGNGSSWAGSGASSTLVFNNTIVGSTSGAFSTTPNILINGGSGNICRNNLFYSVTGTPSTTCSTTSDNGEEASNPFSGYSVGNFRLAAALAGSSTSSPSANATDIDGVTRGADGTWDRGAFEYVAP